MKTIAVTGASGFVGGHVLRAIAMAGHRSIALSRRPVHESQSRWIRLDLEDPDLPTVREIASCDALIHLAWGNLPNYRCTTHLTNELPRHVSFLNQALDAGLRTLVVSGTCLEYGRHEGVCIEAMDTHPTTPYAQAKDSLRKHLVKLRHRGSFNLAWCRLFYTFGDGQAAHSLWQQLRTMAMQGQRRFPMSGGQQIRDFIPVTEIARRLVLMASSQMDPGTVNVCSGLPRTVEGVVRQWIAENHWTIEPELGHFSYPDYEPFAFWGSTDWWQHVEAQAD